MSFEEFAQKVTDGLKQYYEPEAEVIRQDIIKVNDTVHHGITIRQAAKSIAVAPILYLDQYYKEMKEGCRGFDDIFSEIRREIAGGSRPGCLDGAADILVSWEKIKESVYPVLLSSVKNRMYLEDLVTADFLDLKVVYVIRIKTEGDAGVTGTARITRGMLESYGITAEELHIAAMKNLRKECGGIFRMDDILFCSICEDKTIRPVETIDDEGMYCLCNKSGIYGAACLLMADVIQKAAKTRNCFILPSSIHEVLIVPDCGTVTQESLDEMVKSINKTEVSESEILSDHAYYYDAGAKAVRIKK